MLKLVQCASSTIITKVDFRNKDCTQTLKTTNNNNRIPNSPYYYCYMKYLDIGKIGKKQNKYKISIVDSNILNVFQMVFIAV